MHWFALFQRKRENQICANVWLNSNGLHLPSVGQYKQHLHGKNLAELKADTRYGSNDSRFDLWEPNDKARVSTEHVPCTLYGQRECSTWGESETRCCAKIDTQSIFVPSIYISNVEKLPILFVLIFLSIFHWFFDNKLIARSAAAIRSVHFSRSTGMQRQCTTPKEKSLQAIWVLVFASNAHRLCANKEWPLMDGAWVLHE